MHQPDKPRLIRHRFAGKYETILAHGRASLRTVDELRKSPSLEFAARALDDRQRLIQRFVKRLGYQCPPAIAPHTQRQRGDCSIRVSGLGVLHSLPNVLSEHELGFDCFPYTGRLERLTSGPPIRRVLGVCDRNMRDRRLSEIFNTLNLQGAIGARPDCYSSASVKGFRLRQNQPLALELIDEFDVGGREEIYWRSILNLLREHAGRTKAEGDFCSRLLLELLSEFLKRRSEIRGCGDDDLRLRIGRCSARASGHRCQRDEHDQSGHSIDFSLCLVSIQVHGNVPSPLGGIAAYGGRAVDNSLRRAVVYSAG